MRYMVSRRNMNDFDSLFCDLFSDWSSYGRALPAIDLYEKDDSYVLEAEVSQYNKDNIRVDVHKHILSLRYDESKKEEKAQEKKNYLVNEIERPKFERRFSLPEGIAEDKISADFKNGLLVVTMPKTEVAGPKRIDIKFN